MSSANSSKHNIVVRLKKLETVLGLKPAEMASLGGCSRATYYRYRNGESEPTLDFLKRILKHEKNISAEWLLDGKGSVLKNTNGEEKKNISTVYVDGDEEKLHHFPLLKMHSDSKNGKATEASVNSIESISFSKTFLNLLLFNNGNVHYEDSFTMIAVDNCMMPEVKEGGIILVDRKQVTPHSDGIFVVRYDDFVRMKIIQPLPGQKLMLTTLDKKYEPIIVEKDQDGFEILGRIVWSVNPM